jgi:hypothetical protein
MQSFWITERNEMYGKWKASWDEEYRHKFETEQIALRQTLGEIKEDYAKWHRAQEINLWSYLPCAVLDAKNSLECSFIQEAREKYVSFQTKMESDVSR